MIKTYSTRSCDDWDYSLFMFGSIVFLVGLGLGVAFASRSSRNFCRDALALARTSADSVQVVVVHPDCTRRLAP